MQVENRHTKIPQGDLSQCNSFYIVHLKCFITKIPAHLHYHHYYNAHDMYLTPIEHLYEYNYCTKQDKNNTTYYIIDQQYTDDIGFISNNKNIINKAMKNIALILKGKKHYYK